VRNQGIQQFFGGAPGPKEAPVTWALLAANIAIWAGLELTGGSQNPANLLKWGAKYGPAISEGEYWRFISPVFLHVGFFHLLANSIGLIAFGGSVERTFGSLTYAMVYLLSGVLGNSASLLAGPGLGAGASGAIFGISGAFAAYILLNRRELGQLGSQALTSVGLIIAINIVLGFTLASVDNAAHLGGLAGGAALGAAFAPRQRTVVSGVQQFRLGPVVRTVELRPRGLTWLALATGSVALTALLAYAATLSN
jgi:rhomboid protease GluP